MTSFIDTHCHLNMLEITVEEAIRLASAAQVHQMITISVDIPSIQFVSQAVKNWSGVYGSVGLHPHEAAHYRPEVGQAIREAAQSSQKIVAVGETGLDYHYMESPQEAQQTAFRAQLALARELNLPVVLHTREAEADTLAILHENPPPRQGVAHSFTGSVEMAKDLVKMGWCIGFNGIVTFKNAQGVREVLHQIPLERVLLETDAPFLAPVPFRGRPNDPSKIPFIAEFIAQELNLSPEALSAITNDNAQRLFGLTLAS